MAGGVLPGRLGAGAGSRCLTPLRGAALGCKARPVAVTADQELAFKKQDLDAAFASLAERHVRALVIAGDAFFFRTSTKTAIKRPLDRGCGGAR